MTGEQLGEPSEPISVDFDIRWRDANEVDQSETLRIIDAAANRPARGCGLWKTTPVSHG